MLSKTILISIILMISGCKTTPEVVPVIVPPKPYHGTVKRASILQCHPEPVRKEIYRHLRMREQYIETLIAVINAHNGVAAE